MADASALVATKGVRSRTFAALADSPDYRRFYLGQGVSLIGTWLQTAAVSWVVFDLTRSESMLGVIDMAGTMPGLLVGLFAGVMADRVAPRSMILGMQAGQMVLAFLLALLVGSGSVQIWLLALLLALTRVCVTFEMPSRQVFLYELVGRSALMNAIALNSGLFNASRVIGPALAGLCLAKYGRTAPFVLNGISYFAAIAALLSIRAGRQVEGLRAAGSAGLMGGFAYLRRDGHVRGLFLLMAFFGIAGMGYAALIPAYARVVVRTGELGYSLLVSCGGLGATVGALTMASLGGLARKEMLVPAGLAIFGVSLEASGVVPAALGGRAALPMAAVCLFGAGFGAILVFAALQTLIQIAAPDDLRGRIMGIWMIAYSGSVPLGSLWAGLVANRHGVPMVMEVSAALCIATTLAIMPFILSMSSPGAGTANPGQDRTTSERLIQVRRCRMVNDAS